MRWSVDRLLWAATCYTHSWVYNQSCDFIWRLIYIDIYCDSYIFEIAAFWLCWVYICVDWFALTNICILHMLSMDCIMCWRWCTNPRLIFCEDCALLYHYWRLPIDKWGRIGVTALSVDTVYWWLRWRESGDYFEGCVLLEGCLGRIIKSSGFILLIDIKIEDRLIYADWYICVAGVLSFVNLDCWKPIEGWVVGC